MQKKMYFPMSLIAVAIISGCSSMPQNTSLTEAHNSYDSARTNPEVIARAAAELQVAGNSLSKADAALKDGESEATVNQLAYLSQQQVAIARQTAQRKSAEQAVAAASAKRNEIQLTARTAEADAAHQQVDLAKQQTAMVQQTADQQAAALVVASNQSASDQALIAQQDQQLKALNAIKTERGMVITLGDVLFNTDKANLSSLGMNSVQKLADFLKQYSQRKILVEGYTDSTGSEGHNQLLSERRANAVRSALLDMGVTSDRITARGYGESNPVAGNVQAADRQLNRRVEIVLSDDHGNMVVR